MAYMSQEKKAQIAPKVKEILKRYGLKGSLGVHHHSTLQLTIKSGKIDFFANRNNLLQDTAWARPRPWEPCTGYMQVNHYHLVTGYSGVALECLQELKEAMHEGHYDNSDIQSDYFDCAWYISIHIGSWNKHYILES